MAQFVYVANAISNELFEKAMEVKIKSGELVKFIPQGHPSNHGGVSSPGMLSVKAQNQPTAPELLNWVRFEWDAKGADFGAEIVRVLAGHVQKNEQPTEAAA